MGSAYTDGMFESFLEVCIMKMPPRSPLSDNSLVNQFLSKLNSEITEDYNCDYQIISDTFNRISRSLNNDPDCVSTSYPFCNYLSHCIDNCGEEYKPALIEVYNTVM